VHTTALASVA
jgi:hypothetical protein